MSNDPYNAPFNDDTTEPIIAIIGHPIAGNPSQLAIERSLHSLGLEWRVLSFDVAPENVSKALDGFAVTGIAGVMIATNLQSAAVAWCTESLKTTEPLSEQTAVESAVESGAESEKKLESDAGPDSKVETPAPESNELLVNCLHRDESRCFTGSDQQFAYLENKWANRSISNALWLGGFPNQNQRDCWPSRWDLFSDRIPGNEVDAELIAAADLVVLAELDDEDPESCGLDEWPADDGTTFVIDLVGNEAFATGLELRGYIVISCIDLQVGMLAGCIEKWTGKQAPTVTIAEAIEEYFGV